MEQHDAYGLWPSPLTPASMAQALRYGGLAWDTSGERLVWLEAREGRGLLYGGDDSTDAPHTLGGDLSVRAGVGYGGGDFTCARGIAYFVADGRLFRQPLEPATIEDARPRPITPAYGGWASPIVSPDGRWLAAVHTYEDRDSLVVVDVEGARWPQMLSGESDFVMQPRWHPSGTQMAWIAWDHPQMPFQGARLVLADVIDVAGGLPRLGERTVIAGGDEVAAAQPEFSPDGRYLAYLSDETGWGALYLRDLVTGETRLLAGEEGAEVSVPAWVQDVRTYTWSADGEFIYYCRHAEGYAHLWAVHVASGRRFMVPGLETYSHVGQVTASPGGQVAFLATGTAVPRRIVSLRPRRSPERVRSRSEQETLPPAAISIPQPVRWPSTDGREAHGLFFPPRGAGRPAADERPPLLVRVHGGPTSQVFAEYSSAVQFYTTRGYAVLEVNYCGSTGYGRAYAQALCGAWGLADADDAVTGARYIAEQGWADPDRLAIMGGSAGGYTVLQALIRYPGVFRAGLCLYGVVDLFALAADTHKFERHYTDSLVGPLPAAAALYRERSPLFHSDQIRDPVAIFQGEEDRVVPKEQAEAIVAALRRSGVPHEYHLYPGEGHGWRRAATIERFYTSALAFLTRHVLYA
jgi:dipeptidyl aminopeptidase/acylaminoacyl peptidase